MESLTRFKKAGLVFCMVFLFFPSASFAATLYVNYASGNDTTGNGTSGSPYKTFTKVYAMAASGDTIDATGTFTWSNADETSVLGSPSWAGFVITGKNLTIQGHGADQTIFQAGPTAYGSYRVFTLVTSAVTFNNLTIRYGYFNAGGTYYGGACLYVKSDAELTLNYVDVNNCRTFNYYGAAIASYSTTTINNSSIHDGLMSHGATGAGIYFSAAGKTLKLSNSVMYNNTGGWSSNSYTGALSVNAGTAIVTNSTIFNNGNYIATTGGIEVANSATAFLYIKNSIVAGNTTGGTTQDNIYKGASGTIVSGGYNVIGNYSSGGYFTATTGDWTDALSGTATDGVYGIFGGGSSGTLNMDTQATYNDDPNKLWNYGLLSGSIAIDRGNATANNGETIPALDMRGAGRVGTLDIGNFEYNGTGLVVTPPTVQASSVTFSSVDYKKATVGWTNGNGLRRTVFMAQTNTGNAAPADGTRYTPNSIFGLGSQIGSSGWFAIYDGYGTSVSVTGLQKNTTYRVQVFEYNGITDGQTDYMIDTATNNPNNQTTHDPTTIYVNSSAANGGNGTIGSPYNTFTAAYNAAIGGDTIDATGTFSWSNGAETGVAGSPTWAGFVFDNKDLVIQGHGADQTIFQAGPTAYGSYRVFTVNNSSTTITNATIRNGYFNAGSSYYGGACVYASSNSVLTLNYDEIYNCRTYNYVGAAVASYGTTTITYSSIHDGLMSHGASGGGVYINGSGKNHIITNSTIYNNTGGWASNSYVGGVNLEAGTLTMTNNTVTNNGNYIGTTGGVSVGNSASAVLYLKNNIIAGNTTGGTTLDNIYKGASGTIINGGYNIIGTYASGGYFTATTGDWTDALSGTATDGVYGIFGGGSSGTLNLNAAAASTTNNYKTTTYALSAGSIAIDRGNATANNGVAVPLTDQRGGTRNGATDIGAYEYNAGGLTDITSPTASTTAPVINGIVGGTSATLSASASDDVEIAGVKFYVDGILQGSEDTSSPYSVTWNTTPFANGAHTFVAVARDNANNYGTSTATSFIVDNVAPSSVSVTAPTNGSYVSGAAVTISANADDAILMGGVKFYVNGVLQGSEDTAAPYSISWNSTATTSGTKVIFAVARDSANNYATSTSITVTTDNTAPSVSTLFPADNATGVSATTSLAIAFSENITAGASKNIVLKKTSDNSVVETIAANDTNKVAINGIYATTTRSVTLLPSTGYYVNIDAGACTDAALNAYAGISNTTSWNFTTAADTGAPSVLVTAPTAGSTVGGSSIALSANASDDVGVAGVRFYVNGVLQGSEDTTAPYSISWNGTATSSGTKIILAVARDTSNNYATSSPVTFTLDNSTPNFSSISATPNATGAVVSWTSDSLTSSLVRFGLTSSYGSSTAETNLSPRVLLHSVSIPYLKACTTYHYQVSGANAAGTWSSSSDRTFITTGCTGGATVSSSDDNSIPTSTGGTVSSGSLLLVVPASFTTATNTAVFQVKQIENASFTSAAGAPTGKTRAGTNVFHLKAYSDEATIIPTFIANLTVSLTYTDNEISGIQEPSLKIYRYDGSSWYALSNCSVNTSLKKVTCDTAQFSDFALFGDPTSSSSTTATVTTTTVSGGSVPLSYLKNVAAPVAVSVQEKPIQKTTLAVFTSSYVFKKNLRRGTYEKDVKKLQQFLNANGYVICESGEGSPGKETTFFGKLTMLALARFQKDQGITPAEGYFGEKTRAFINKK